MKRFFCLFLALCISLSLAHSGAAAASTDSLLDSMVRIDARADFAFRYDLSNKTAGESSPILQDYYLSKYKVTNAQYKTFLDDTGRKAPSYWKNGTYPSGKAQHPVLNVSYSDAAAYCAWLSSQYSGWQFRLPTETEWENAAMGAYYGDTSVKYPTNVAPAYEAQTYTLTTDFNYNGVIAAQLFAEYGEDHIVNYIKGDFAGDSETLGQCIQISKTGGVTNWANHGGNATKGYFLQTDLYAQISADGGNTTPVGSYAPNTLGLYDMAGNCWDLTSSKIIAVNGLEAGVECYAVRGGSWYATARSCTFHYRGEGRKDHPSATVGFRIAADVPEEATQLQINTVSLRPSVAGLYFKASFTLPEELAASRYGIVVSVYNQLPVADGSDPKSLWSEGSTSLLISNILSSKCSDASNQNRAAMPIYARAYAQLEDGSYLYSDVAVTDLRQVVEAADALWSTLDAQQKADIAAMYDRFQTILDTWNLPNLQNNQIAATMTQQAYNGLNYWLYTPANPTANMPLIVYLHGGSGKGENLNLLTDVDGFPQYIKDGRIACDAYIIFPQCPSSQKGWKTMGSQIEALISYTCSTYALNTQKVSLTGHSMGGTGTWTLALDKPELFYKIAPMSGSVTVNNKNIATLSNIPVWAFVGSKDKIVSPDTSIAMIDALTQADANATITILEGADHFSVPSLGYLSTDVISWLTD